MSIKAINPPNREPNIFGVGRDFFGRESIRVDRCPICGSSCLPGSCATQRLAGFDIRDGYAYTFKNLCVTFCRDCLIGKGGVDIICRVIEANEVQRNAVEKDAHAILKQLHDELMTKIRNWAIGIGATLAIIGVCCVIWKPEDVFACLGAIAFLFVIGCLQGRR